MSKHFLPRKRSDLREAVFGVVRVHCEDFFALGRAKNFDNFDELVDARFSREDWLAEHKLSNNAAD